MPPKKKEPYKVSILRVALRVLLRAPARVFVCNHL
jgi:hypothetical protein